MKVERWLEWDTEESRVLESTSVSDRGRSYVLISLEGGMSSPNLDTTQGCQHKTSLVLLDIVPPSLHITYY
jgi:hypothetical protein